MSIPVEQSPAEKFVDQMGWSSKPSGTDNVCVQVCPFCKHEGFKFYIHVGGEKDGLWSCVICSEKGNLHQLRDRLGVRTPNAFSVKDMAAGQQTLTPLPDFNALHWRLMNDAKMGEVLDYLVAERKFSIDVIKRLKLGAHEFKGKKTGEPTKAFVIPYFDAAGNAVNFKARSVPPAGKEFWSPSGREAGLYNEAALTRGMNEVVIVEGESDTIALLSHGYEHVVGVPGASTQKTAWVTKFDELEPKTIYLLYDRDKVGQENARKMAAKIGIEKCKNILLPPFPAADQEPWTDNPKGKDINEWLAAGNSVEDLRKLMDEAKVFDVAGVQGVGAIVEEIISDLDNQGSLDPTYKSPWSPLNEKIGGFDNGDLIGLMAEGKVGKTTMALNWVHWLSAECGVPTLLFCLEMPPKKLVRKWVSHVTKTPDELGKSQITKDTMIASMGVAGEMKADLLFGYSKSNKWSEVSETIRQAVRRYGVKVVAFDNLQMLVRSLEHSAQETGRLTKDFKALAMELGIAIILIVQPNRVPEGQMVRARNAMGSSAIEKDVDTMICLHRDRVAPVKAADLHGFIDTDATMNPQMYATVDLSRYAAGGMCTLWMNGATSTVREMGEDDLTPTPQAGPGGIPVEESQI
jgi:hypothetical protein